MKAEDVERIYSESNPDDHWVKIDVYWEELSAEERQRMINFARACEQQGVERAKALASATCLHECRACGGEGYDECADDDGDCGPCKGSGESLDKVEIDWSALDAEIRKENEG
jgi:hypothetical protein